MESFLSGADDAVKLFPLNFSRSSSSLVNEKVLLLGVRCRVGRLGTGNLIGSLHGCTVTDKGRLNRASSLLFRHTNMQWEALDGGVAESCGTHAYGKLQKTLNVWGSFLSRE